MFFWISVKRANDALQEPRAIISVLASSALGSPTGRLVDNVSVVVLPSCPNASFALFHSEILPDSQPYVGHGECGEVGGRPSGIKNLLVMFTNMSHVKTSMNTIHPVTLHNYDSDRSAARCES